MKYLSAGAAGCLAAALFFGESSTNFKQWGLGLSVAFGNPRGGAIAIGPFVITIGG